MTRSRSTLLLQQLQQLQDFFGCTKLTAEFTKAPESPRRSFTVFSDLPVLMLLPLLSLSSLREAPGKLLPDPGHGRRGRLPVLRGKACRGGGVHLQGGQGGHDRLQQDEAKAAALHPAPLTHK